MAIYFNRGSVGAGKNEIRTLDGKEFYVVPATIIVAGVLNGGLVTAEELQVFTERWNGRPIPIRHPKNADGDYISASSPEVVEQHVVGTFYNARFDENRIVGEMWLDPAKMRALGGAALLTLERLEAGDTIEVSTGYWAESIYDVRGIFNDKVYHEVQKGLVPDHIALLPDEIGACSVIDGCGAGIYNESQDFSQTVMVAFFLSPEVSAKLSKIWEDEKTAVPERELHVTIAYLGKLNEMETSFERLAMLLSEYARNQIAMLGNVGGIVRFSGEQSDAIALLVDSESLSSFRRWIADSIVWELDQPVSRPNQYIPHITIGYAEKDSTVSLPAVESTPLAFTQLALSYGDQTIVFPLVGELRTQAAIEAAEGIFNMSEKTAKQGATPCEKTKELRTNADEGGNDGAQNIPKDGAQSAAPASQALPAEFQELAEMIKGFGGVEAVKSAIGAAVANRKSARAERIAEIKANKAVSLSDEELEALPDNALVALAAVGRQSGADYSGSRGAIVNASFPNGSEDFEDFS